MILNEMRPAIDWLTYRSYEKNRKANPHIEYFRWRKIFKDAVEFEEIFDRNFPAIMRGE